MLMAEDEVVRLCSWVTVGGGSAAQRSSPLKGFVLRKVDDFELLRRW